MTNDLDRKPVILIFRGGKRCSHAPTLTRCVGVQQVDNAAKWYLAGGLPYIMLRSGAAVGGAIRLSTVTGHDHYQKLLTAAGTAGLLVVYVSRAGPISRMARARP